MKRLTRFTIPALILLFVAAVCWKLMFTAIELPESENAWKWSDLGRSISWDRGWPWRFVQIHMSIPPAPTVSGIPSPPPTIHYGELSAWALVGDLLLAATVMTLVGFWICRRTRRPRPWSFSLRAILVATLFFAACCGWWAYEQRLWQREQDALATLREVGFYTTRKSDTAPAWLRRLLTYPVFVPDDKSTPIQPSHHSISSYCKRALEWPSNQLKIFVRSENIYWPRERSDGDLLMLASAISNFSSLREFSIPGRDVKIEPKSLKPLAACRSLEMVRLSYSNVDAACIAEIADLPRLKELNLYECDNINDNAIESLLRLQTLETLWLHGTRITDRGALRLLQLPNLKQLGLPEGTSQETIEQFRGRGVKVHEVKTVKE